MKNNYTDIHQDLIILCQSNDRKAQAEIYRLYGQAMYNICTRMLVNTDEAKDALQEAFIAAFKNIGQYSHQAAFGAWLKRIVINKCVLHLKKLKQLHTTPYDDFDWVDEPEDDYQPDPKVIQEAIKSLPPKSRAVFTLFCLEGYDHQEIAEILDISVGTSKSQFNYARKLLQTALKHVLS